VIPETTAPGVPPAPTIALPSPSPPPPSAVVEEDRVAPPSTPRSEQDLRTKLRDDWEGVKRDARSATTEIKEAFRKFRDWLAYRGVF